MKPQPDRIGLAARRHHRETIGQMQANGCATRLRVGDYRVIFVETETEITVLNVVHRREVHR